MKKALNILLMITFVLTLLVPLTGVQCSQVRIAAVSFALFGAYRFALEKNGGTKGLCTWFSLCVVSDWGVWADF